MEPVPGDSNRQSGTREVRAEGSYSSEAAETYDFGSNEPKEVPVVPMPVPSQGEKHEKAMSEEPESKRVRVEPAEAKQPAGNTAQASGGPVQFNIATPDASMGTGSQDLDLNLYWPSLSGDAAQDMVSCVRSIVQRSLRGHLTKELPKGVYDFFTEESLMHVCFDANAQV